MNLHWPESFLNELWICLWHFSLIHWLCGILAGGWFLWFIVLQWYNIRVQYRTGINLKRCIYFLDTNEVTNFQTEFSTIEALKLFKVHSTIQNISTSISNLDNLAKKAIYIVKYSEKYSFYDKLFEYARHNNIPIIIYAKQWGITNSLHWNIFNEYIYCDVVNTPNRIAMVLLNICKILK